MEPEAQSANETLKDIRNIMERSTRFTNFSGWSLIVPGVLAVLGGGYLVLNDITSYTFDLASPGDTYSGPLVDHRMMLVVLIIVLGASGLAAYYFNLQKAKRNGQSLFDGPAKRAIINFGIPMFFGGLFCILTGVSKYTLVGRHELGNFMTTVMPSLMLLFYGFGLIGASKYSLQELRNMGLFQCVLGLIAALPILFIGSMCWLLGFGFLNIIFGIIILRKNRA